MSSTRAINIGIFHLFVFQAYFINLEILIIVIIMAQLLNIESDKYSDIIIIIILLVYLHTSINNEIISHNIISIKHSLTKCCSAGYSSQLKEQTRRGRYEMI